MADEQNPSEALPNGWIAITEEGDTMKVSDCKLGKGCIFEGGNKIYSISAEVYVLKSYFTNIGTHQTFNTREELNRYVEYASRANLPQRVDCNQLVKVRCTRCWCTGHTAPECTCSDRLVKVYNEMLFGRANEKVRKCKRCGRGGHNIRNCHGPIFKSSTPSFNFCAFVSQL